MADLEVVFLPTEGARKKKIVFKGVLEWDWLDIGFLFIKTEKGNESYNGQSIFSVKQAAPKKLGVVE